MSRVSSDTPTHRAHASLNNPDLAAAISWAAKSGVSSWPGGARAESAEDIGTFLGVAGQDDLVRAAVRPRYNHALGAVEPRARDGPILRQLVQARPKHNVGELALVHDGHLADQAGQSRPPERGEPLLRQPVPALNASAPPLAEVVSGAELRLLDGVLRHPPSEPVVVRPGRDDPGTGLGANHTLRADHDARIRAIDFLGDATLRVQSGDFGKRAERISCRQQSKSPSMRPGRSTS